MALRAPESVQGWGDVDDLHTGRSTFRGPDPSAPGNDQGTCGGRCRTRVEPCVEPVPRPDPYIQYGFGTTAIGLSAPRNDEGASHARDTAFRQAGGEPSTQIAAREDFSDPDSAQDTAGFLLHRPRIAVFGSSGGNPKDPVRRPATHPLPAPNFAARPWSQLLQGPGKDLPACVRPSEMLYSGPA